ncbi:MAG: DUF2238 domain-containing protein [Nitrospinae bacterium]|nr:DUF2238 domain-containing protein [Nitrospinota bacterium]
MTTTPSSRYPLALLGATSLVLLWSVIGPHDLFTWFLESVPAMIAVVVLVATYGRFRFSNFVYTIIAIHCVILMVGGHYTYAEVPLGNWARDTFGLDRNYYDRVGHFFQGFSPALVAREILTRVSPIPRGGWMNFVLVSFALAVSAFYELIEWWVAVGTGEAAEAFLGTQGDVWDTQWDMCMALVGVSVAILFFSRLHDRAMADHP